MWNAKILGLYYEEQKARSVKAKSENKYSFLTFQKNQNFQRFTS